MNSEMYQRMAEVEREHWWYEGRKAIICQTIRDLGLPRNARILDVGCGTGALTEKLAEFGSVVGCEPSELAVSEIRTESGIVVIRPGELAAQSQWRGHFDLIGFFDVLEHAESDVALLNQYLPFLKEDGVIVVTVPAWQMFWGDHDVASRHFRRYRLSTLISACDAAGLRLVRSTYFNLLLAPLILLVRTSNRIRAKSSGCGDLTLPSPSMNALLKRVFMLEAHLLRLVRLPFGVSLLAVFRRSAKSP